jgi:glycosyltransferase involved in cell wall biosynthesis
MESKQNGRAEVVVNVRTLKSAMTGVQRYARSVKNNLTIPVDEIAPSGRGGGMIGHFWEQFILPLALKNRLLWSPGNTGPLLVKNQVATILDLSVSDHPEWFKPSYSRWYRFFTPRLAARCKRIITISEFSKSRILAHCPVSPDKIVVTYLGVDPAFAPGGDSRWAGVSSKYEIRKPFAIFVGSLEPRKNLGRLLEAWQNAGCQGLELVIVGARGQVFAGTGFGALPAGCKTLGRVPDAELSVLYSNAEFSIYPSLYEGFGLPPLESMASGCRALVSNAGSLPEVCDDAAVYCDPHSSADIAAKIKLMRSMSADAIGEFRRKGLARAARFTWEACGKATSEVLQDVLRRDRPAGESRLSRARSASVR